MKEDGGTRRKIKRRDTGMLPFGQRACRIGLAAGRGASAVSGILAFA